MLHRVLAPPEEALLAEERECLARLHRALARHHADGPSQEALAQSVRRLDELFLLVVIGEFNSGKSTFINALLGRRVLDEGATPATRRIQLLVHGPQPALVSSAAAVDVLAAPAEVLRTTHIVDTPGTDAIFREHESITAEFLPRADLILFVISADRPFTEAGRGFMEAIREWGRKTVVVVNKAEILASPADLTAVAQYVRASAAALLGVAPPVFMVSARAALRARTAHGPAAGDRSFDELERYLTATLDERARLRLKLLKPLGVGLHVAARLLADVRAQRTRLDEDMATLDAVERELAIYREHMGRDFVLRLSSVDGILHEFERRGVTFFDNTLRIGRVADLVNAPRLKSAYERDVVQDMPRRIERAVHDIIDWLVASDLRLWQGVRARVEARRAAHVDRLAFAVDTRFEHDRARLLDTVGRAVQRTVDGCDHRREAETMAESVRMAVAGTALAEVGALGLGAAVTALATTTFADVTGILAAGALAVLGLFVIPVSRRQAKAAMRTRVELVRWQLMESLTSQFDREVDRSVARVRDAIAPSSRFVRAEHQRLGEAIDELDALGSQLACLQRRAERPGGP